MAKKRISDNPARWPSRTAKKVTTDYQSGRWPPVKIRPPALLTATPEILKRRG